jgi:lysophospholipase L1-like esterase
MRSVLLSTLLLSCTESRNPFGGDVGPRVDTGASMDAASPMDAEPAMDAGEMDASAACAPIPSRMVILGDSITACVGAGGKDSPTCGPKALHTELAATIAPGLTYENNAVGRAVTADVSNTQLQTVQGGPGHVLVLIYIGGNDLAQYIFVSDREAQNGYDQNLPSILASWQTIFQYFADRTRFPDGTTILMNTQYNPFDDCTAAPYNLSALKIDLLHQFNQNLVDLAESNPDARIADQFTPFLGHGHHYTVASCPHYMAGAAYWMDDLIHANEAGHESFVAEWRKSAEQLYVTCQ